MSGSAESRAELLLGGRLGRAMLADLAGLDSLTLLAAAGMPPPAGVAFLEPAIGAAVGSTLQESAERVWYSDPLALLASVARAGDQWEPPLTALPGGQAGLLRPLAAAVAGAPAARRRGRDAAGRLGRRPDPVAAGRVHRHQAADHLARHPRARSPLLTRQGRGITAIRAAQQGPCDIDETLMVWSYLDETALMQSASGRGRLEGNRRRAPG